jgi:hypothetical protein
MTGQAPVRRKRLPAPPREARGEGGAPQRAGVLLLAGALLVWLALRTLRACAWL